MPEETTVTEETTIEAPKAETENQEVPAQEGGNDAPSVPGLNEDDPKGFQNRMNSIYGKLKGTERERDNFKEKIESLEGKLSKIESRQTEKDFENKREALKAKHLQAIEDGDDKKASDLMFEFAEMQADAKRVEPQTIKNDPIPSQEISHGSAVKERFYTKYQDVAEDQVFKNLAHQVDAELKQRYANEINSGHMTEDTFFYLLDSGIEASVKSGNKSLQSFSATSGVPPSPGAGAGDTNAKLTESQKKMAERWVLDGTCKTKEDAYKKYARASQRAGG